MPPMSFAMLAAKGKESGIIGVVMSDLLHLLEWGFVYLEIIPRFRLFWQYCRFSTIGWIASCFVSSAAGASLESSPTVYCFGSAANWDSSWDCSLELDQDYALNCFI